MSLLNPNESGGDSHNWNYSKPDGDGFSLTLTGTVKAIQEVQAMNFGADGRPSTPKFWDNSNQPVMNIKLVLCGPSGGYRTWTITPAGKAAKEGKKRSVHLDLFALAGGKNLLDLIEKTIKITTVAPPTGFNYGIGNPRPWTVELVDVPPYQLAEPLEPIYLMPKVLADGAVSGGAMQPQSYTPPASTQDAPQPMSTGMPPVADQPPVSDDIPF
jgi:hypothetical protein